MPRKASGESKVKRIERLQSNGDIYIYEVTTRYNPEKRYNEHVSSKLLGKKSLDGTGILPTRPRKTPGTNETAAVRKTVGAMDILEWIGRESGIDDDMLSSADIGTAQKVISIARFWMANPDKSICMTRRISHQFTYERQRTRGDVAKGSITVEEHRLYLHFILDTGRARLDTAVLMKEIQHVKQQ